MRRLRVPLVPRWLRWSGVLAAAVVIFYLSVVVSPGPGAGKLLGPYWDKYLHAVAYAGLAVLTAYTTADWRDFPYRRGTAVVLATVTYGVIVEFAQLAVPYRQFNPLDLVANAAGALLVMAWFLVEARVRYRRVDVPIPPLDSILGREE